MILLICPFEEILLLPFFMLSFSHAGFHLGVSKTALLNRAAFTYASNIASSNDLRIISIDLILTDSFQKLIFIF